MLGKIFWTIALMCLMATVARAEGLEEVRKKFEAAKGKARKEAAKAYIDELIPTAEAQVILGKTKEAIALYRKGLPVAVYAKHRLDEIREGAAWAAKVMAAKGDETKIARLVRDPPSEKFGRAKVIILRRKEGVSMKCVLMPSGSFKMGGGDAQRKVTIKEPFYIGVTEVTQEQYESVMGTNPSKFKGAKNPVEQVTWQDALAFCKKVSALTYRNVQLPSEAQWEYACRAGTETAFCYGDDKKYEQTGDYAWHRDNSKRQSHPVAQKKPNAWGLYDMHGNLWEYAIGANGRVQRGGGFYDGPEHSRSTGRCSAGADGFKHDATGFRVIITKKER